MVAILAFCAPLLTVGPAGAHSCVLPTEVPVGEPVSVNLGVPAEREALSAVEVTVPDGFELLEVGPAPGWDVTEDGDTVRYQGGLISRFACGYFTLRGTATEKGRLVFPFTLRTVDGETLEFSADEGTAGHGQAQYVFAGVEPFFDEGAGSQSRVGTVGLVLIGGGVVAAVVLCLKRSGRLARRRQPSASP